MIKRLLYLSNFVFLLLYVTLAWHNRLINDDFHYLADVHKYGIIYGTRFEYNIYSTRWLSVCVLNVILSLMNSTNALFLFSILTLAAFIFSLSYLLKNLFQCFFSYNPGNILLANLGIFTINAFFYSTFDIGASWFWLSALPTYIWSFIFFCLGCGIIISSKKYPVFKWILLTFSFFYIGGSYEAFAAVLLLALAVGTVYIIFFCRNLPGKKMYLARIFISFFFCLVSLIVLYMGHGNTVRRNIIGEISLLHAFVLTIETTGWIGLHWISRILPAVLIFSLPLIYRGKLLSIKYPQPEQNYITTLKKISVGVLLYGLLIFILNYPVTYLICGIGPGRALLPVSFVTWGIFAFAFFYTGYKSGMKEKMVKNLTVMALCLCLSLNIFNTVQQYIITRNYARAYDALMKELADKKNSNQVIVVSKMPYSGMLPSIDISTDSTANNNMFIKQSLNLKADIMLAK